MGRQSMVMLGSIRGPDAQTLSCESREMHGLWNKQQIYQVIHLLLVHICF